MVNQELGKQSEPIVRNGLKFVRWGIYGVYVAGEASKGVYDVLEVLGKYGIDRLAGSLGINSGLYETAKLVRDANQIQVKNKRALEGVPTGRMIDIGT